MKEAEATITLLLAGFLGAFGGWSWGVAAAAATEQRLPELMVLGREVFADADVNAEKVSSDEANDDVDNVFPYLSDPSYHLLPAHASSSHTSPSSHTSASSISSSASDSSSTRDFFSSFTPPGGRRFVEYTTGSSPYNITPAVRRNSDRLARSRRDHVRDAMRHAWDGYRRYAFGRDELKPRSKTGRDNWGGMGTTLVDSLDTLWLMGLRDEFWEGRDWVRDTLNHSTVGRVSVFETSIRSLGGMLSAYDLSGDEAFLIQADDLASRLIKAFDTKSGLPYSLVDLRTGKASNFGWLPDQSILAEFGTLQVEFRYLAKVTGKAEYAQKSERIFEILHSLQPSNGLFPLYFKNSVTEAEFSTERISFGAMGDSVYEYFLKVWLQGGRTEDKYREMYDRAIDGLHEELLFRSEPSGLTYIAERSGKKKKSGKKGKRKVGWKNGEKGEEEEDGDMEHKMDHLVCFMSGTLALGAYTDPRGLNSTRAQRDLRTGKALAYTCHQMYARMDTGIAPEFVRFNSDSPSDPDADSDAPPSPNDDFDVEKHGSYYLLRPEAVESFFVLHQLTRDPIYRQWGWEIFVSIERFCRLDVAYGGLKDVRIGARPEDKMESFFLAETLKYLFLLQDPDTEVDILGKHVFNTEAHPLRLLSEVELRHPRPGTQGGDPSSSSSVCEARNGTAATSAASTTSADAGDAAAAAYPYLPDSPPPLGKGKGLDEDHDFSTYQPLGGDRYAEYKDGLSPYTITPTIKSRSDDIARTRRYHIRKAMVHAWDGYRRYAFGRDELRPKSRSGMDVWGGMGTTLVDSLDTLWIMGLRDEFWEGRDWVRDNLNHDTVGKVSVFETTIRSLGGLLSAYDLSGDRAFLTKADDLGSRLFKALDTPSGIPYGQVDLTTGKPSDFKWNPGKSILSEFGTLQVEFRYLAKVTGKTEYAEGVERIYDALHSVQPPDGLFPLYYRRGDRHSKPQPAGTRVSFGAMGDSVYEYFLKVWLQGGRKEDKYREMYDKAIYGLHEELVFRSEPSGLTYVAERNGGKVQHKMDHLVCFLSGTLALGAYTDPTGSDSERARRDMKTARALAYTCHQMYARQNTGISPEIVKFNHHDDANNKGKKKKKDDFDVVTRDAFYILRPEAVESFYILNKLTGDPVYREWGWEIFQSIERYCKLDVGYGSLRNVNKPQSDDGGPNVDDKMESFFLAETMKYLYLLQDPDAEIDLLTKHVFNTEAHPLRLLDDVEQIQSQTIGLATSATSASATTRHVTTITSTEKGGGVKSGSADLAPFPYLSGEVCSAISTKEDFASYKPLGGNRYPEYMDGSSPYAITASIRTRSDTLARSRRDHVRDAMKHTWEGYKRYAFGMDELKPLSKRGTDNWGGLGTTLVDSLSTLWLMDLRDEFYEGRDWVSDRHLEHSKVKKPISVFETTIRNLGGLLSAYDLSGDAAFLERADELGSRLLEAFDTPTGLPYTQVNLHTGQVRNRPQIPKGTLLAECGTLQLEFRYLARVTGRAEYAEKVERVYDILGEIQPENGLWPVNINNLEEKKDGGIGFGKSKVVSFGSLGDSAYEYLLKTWLQGGRTESKYREMYDRAIQGLHDELLHISDDGSDGLTYVAKLGRDGKLERIMDHLVCFLGGTLALGAYTDPLGLGSERAQRDLRTGRALAYTCYQMYAQTSTGIAPEAVQFDTPTTPPPTRTDTDKRRHAKHKPHDKPNPNPRPKLRHAPNADFYLLRPETVESFYILHTLTHDPIYREWGWEIFQAMQRYCRTDVAYGGLHRVDGRVNGGTGAGGGGGGGAIGKEGGDGEEGVAPYVEDRMESFFLAETLKYLFLLFDPDTEMDILDEFVFNTEAHPLRNLDRLPLQTT